MKTTKTIEYPIKDMVSFEDRGDGTWRLLCELEPLEPLGLKELGELDHQINKFIEEDGRFIITNESYWDEVVYDKLRKRSRFDRLPMIVFPNPNNKSPITY